MSNSVDMSKRVERVLSRNNINQTTLIRNYFQHGFGHDTTSNFKLFPINLIN